jgi:hypothetical protein
MKRKKEKALFFFVQMTWLFRPKDLHDSWNSLFAIEPHCPLGLSRLGFPNPDGRFLKVLSKAGQACGVGINMGGATKITK